MIHRSSIREGTVKPDWSDDAARLLPTVLRHHLAATGWRDVETNESARYWRYAMDVPRGRVMVDVPKSTDFIDYDRRVVELMEILALVEQRAARLIVFELSHPEANILSPSPGTVVDGYVASFAREATDPTRPGEVVLIATMESRPGTPRVHMELSPEAYAQALRAHQAAQRVRVTGTLTREGRRYVLRDPVGLRIMSGAKS